MVKQGLSRRTKLQGLNGAEDDVVRGHRLDLDDAAIKRYDSRRERGRTSLQRRPSAFGKALVEMQPSAAGKRIGELFFSGRKCVHAEDAVLCEDGRAGRTTVETNQQHRRLIRHRTD